MAIDYKKKYDAALKQVNALGDKAKKNRLLKKLENFNHYVEEQHAGNDGILLDVQVELRNTVAHENDVVDEKGRDKMRAAKARLRYTEHGNQSTAALIAGRASKEKK